MIHTTKLQHSKLPKDVSPELKDELTRVAYIVHTAILDSFGIAEHVGSIGIEPLLIRMHSVVAAGYIVLGLDVDDENKTDAT